MRILHTADLHLGRALSSFGEAAVREIRSQIDLALNKLKDILSSGAYDGLILVGDVFEDPKISFYYMMLVTRIFEAQLKSGGFVCYATGNHDYWVGEQHFASLKKYDKFFPFFGPAFKTVAFQQGDERVVVHGLGYGEARPASDVTHYFPDREAGEADIVIGLMHGVIGRGELQSPYYSLDASRIASKKYNYFALGHVHSFTEGEGYMAYPGTPFPQGYDEKMRAGYNEVTIDAGSTELKSEELVSYRIYDLGLSLRAESREDVVLKTQDFLEEELREEALRPLVRLELTVEGPLRLEKELREELKADIVGPYAPYVLDLRLHFRLLEEGELPGLNPEVKSLLTEALTRFREGRAITEVQGMRKGSLNPAELIDAGDVERAILADLEG